MDVRIASIRRAELTSTEVYGFLEKPSSSHLKTTNFVNITVRQG